MGGFFIDIDVLLLGKQNRIENTEPLALLDAARPHRRKQSSHQGDRMSRAAAATAECEGNHTAEQKHSGHEGDHEEEDDLERLECCLGNVNRGCNTQREYADNTKQGRGNVNSSRHSCHDGRCLCP